MTIYQNDLEEITRNANQIKDSVILGLELEGFLTKPATEIAAHYAVIIHKKGWFGRFWDRWFAGMKDEKMLRVSFVKIIEKPEA